MGRAGHDHPPEDPGGLSAVEVISRRWRPNWQHVACRSGTALFSSWLKDKEYYHFSGERLGKAGEMPRLVSGLVFWFLDNQDVEET